MYLQCPKAYVFAVPQKSRKCLVATVIILVLANMATLAVLTPLVVYKVRILTIFSALI
jgi:hypothetical protein